jgi:O-antigen ligase
MMFIDAPITGHGYLAYRELHTTYGDPYLRSPHNEWLRLFAEGGILLGLAGLSLVTSTFATLWRSTGWIPIGALAAFVGWAIAATFNNPLLFVQVGVIAMIVVATGLARSISSPPTEGGAQEPVMHETTS